MCDPVSIAIAATYIAAGVAGQVSAQQGRVAQKKMAKANANLQRNQVKRQLAQKNEAAAEKSLELSRAYHAAKGQVAVQDLAQRSAAAIGRSIGFEVGRDQAVIASNTEEANLVASAQLRGIDITLESQKLQIGDTSGLALGLGITEAAISGAGAGMSFHAAAGGGGGGGKSGGSKAPTESFQMSDLDAPKVGDHFTSSALQGLR